MKVGSLLKGWCVVGVAGFVAFVVWLLYGFGRRYEEPPRDSTMFFVWFGWLFVWVWVLGVLCLCWCLVWLNRRREKALVVVLNR